MLSAASALIMEDNPYLIRLYRSVLRKAGFEVYEATSFEQARTLLATFRFGAIICDLEMGHADCGLGLLHEHRAMLAALGTRIVAISGQEVCRAQCSKMGIEFVLAKPVSGHQLESIMLNLSTSDTRPAIIAHHHTPEIAFAN